MEKQVFVRIFVSNDIRTLAKRLRDNVKVLDLKKEILRDLGLDPSAANDFYLWNITTGEAASEPGNFTCNDQDVIIMSKQACS